MLAQWPTGGSTEWGVMCEGSALALWSCLGCGQKGPGTGGRPGWGTLFMPPQPPHPSCFPRFPSFPHLGTTVRVAGTT